MCEGRTISGSSLCVRSGQRFSNLCRGCAPRIPANKETPTQQFSRTKPPKYKSPPLRKGEGCVKGGPSAGPPFAFDQGRDFQICTGYAFPVPRPTKKTPTQQLSRTKPPKYKSHPLCKGEGCVKGGPSAGPPFAFNQGRDFQVSAGYALSAPRPTKKTPEGVFLLVGMTGFEPATSASRTQRSTKLSHIPLRIPSLLSNGEGTGGCPTRIRTQTNRVRVCRATFTQSGNSNMNYYNGSGEKVKTYRKKTAFIFYFWRKVPLIARAVRRTIHIANAKPMKERNKPCLTRKPRTH